MAGMITRCPKCATAFRISDAHLKSAKGMVRCGNCLNVFNARENIQNKGPAEIKQPKNPTKQATAAAHAAQSSSNSEASATNPFLKKSSSLSNQDSTSKHSTTPPKGTLDSNEADHTDEEEDDESWALELLKDDSDLNIKFKKIVTPKDKAADKSTVTSTTAPPTSPKSAHQALTKKDATQPAVKKVMSGPTWQQADEAQPTKTSDVTAKYDIDIPESTIQDMLAAIEPEALEVNWEDDKTRRKKQLIWMGSSLAACLALLIQFAWLEFYRLSLVDPYRSLYALACPTLGCTLPERKNLKAIATSNLVVRTHPNEQNALMVDVILQNNAKFEQNFPSILLTFSDMNNKPVAARRFKSTEYLGGELAGISHMPVKRPIHIAIEIQDPGLTALSYNIAVVD